MAKFGAAATCLTGTFVAFITQEAARLTEKAASIAASFTDPLDLIADANIQEAVDGVSALAEPGREGLNI